MSSSIRKSGRLFIIKLVVIIGIGIFSTTGLFAQSIVTGYILSKQDSLPVTGAHLIINGTVRVASLAPDGSFSFLAEELPVYISISHISFYQKTIKISRSQKTRIYLDRKELYLPQVEISAIPQRNLIKDKKIYVIDYAFEGNSILLLSYKNQKLNQAALVVINTEGDTLKSCDIHKPDYLFNDCFGINHLINKELASQVFVDSNDIKLLYQIEKDSFLQIFNSIIAYSNHRYYIRKDDMANQVVRLFVFDSRDTTFRELLTIVDEGGIERLSDKGRLQSASGYSASDARFEEMCFYNSKVIPVFVKNDSILVFNTVDNKLEIYNETGNLLRLIDFDFHLQNHWDKKIIQDHVTGKIYAQFTKRGITTLTEVDINTGGLGKKTEIPAMNFVQKIRINNNKIYFLYNDIHNNSYKQIYTMNF